MRNEIEMRRNKKGHKEKKIAIYSTFRKYGLKMKDFVNPGKATLVLATVLVLVASGLVLSIPTTTPTSSTGTEQQQSVMAQTAAANNDTVQVEAGSASMIGNGTSPLTAFLPQSVEIKAGESVTWVNPTPVPEPHSITFLTDNKLFAPPLAPFTVPNSTEFTLVTQGANAEPTIVPSSGSNNASKTVVIDNARSSSPVVIDSTGKNVTYLSPNGTYAFQGNEQYLNSGWMWPEGVVPPGAPYLATFTVKFDEPGMYPYLCIVHPWMTGTVEVT